MCSKQRNFPAFCVLASLLFFMCGSVVQTQEKEKAITLDTDPNLVGWWKFDDVSGKTAVDSSKHGPNGELKESMSFDENSVQGRIGKALAFAGRDDCIQITGFKGLIDDARIYDRALPEDETKALFELKSNRPVAK